MSKIAVALDSHAGAPGGKNWDVKPEQFFAPGGLGPVNRHVQKKIHFVFRQERARRRELVAVVCGAYGGGAIMGVISREVGRNGGSGVFQDLRHAMGEGADSQDHH